MVTVNSSGHIRFSSRVVKSAGFRPGQHLAIVPTSKTSFDIIPAHKALKNGIWSKYSVEKDGRVRVSKSTLLRMGVNCKRNGINTISNKGSIVVVM